MLPVWIPVVFGVLTPVSFTANGILTKYMSEKSEKQGKVFDASTISFSSYIVVNVIVMFFAIPYWYNVEFN